MSSQWVWLLVVAVLALPAMFTMCRAIVGRPQFVWLVGLGFCAGFWFKVAQVLDWI